MRVPSSQRRSRSVFDPLLMCIENPTTRLILLRRAHAVVDVTPQHVRRRTRLQRLVEKTKGTPALMGAAMRHLYKPSTTISYLATVMKMHPELKRDQQLRVIVSATRQELGAEGTRKAVPIHPQQVAKFLSVAPKDVAATGLTLYLTASRHGDLAHLRQYEWRPPTLTLAFRNFKSDRYGMRNVHKFVDIPTLLWKWIPRAAPNASYRSLLRDLKKVSNELSVHSLRRGAATRLAEAGYAMKDIGLLTAHAPTDDPSLGVRRYVDPSPTQPEGVFQRCMGNLLAREVVKFL